MAKKKRDGERTRNIGLHVKIELYERFQALSASMVPRVSTTALLEAAIMEYLERHEPKTKKEGKQ